MATEDLSTQQGWDGFVQRHGGIVGKPYKVTDDRDASGRRVQDPFYHYELGDGSTVEMNNAGEIKSLDEKKTAGPAGQTINDPRTGEPIAVTTPSGGTVTLPRPTAPQGWTEVQGIRNADGTTTYYGRDPGDGQFKKVPGLPNGAATPSTTAKPTPADQLEQIKDPTTGKVVKLRDPSTGTVIDLPDGATATKPSVVQGQNGAMYSWDGSTLKSLLPANPDAPLTKEFNGTLFQWNPKTQHWDTAIAGAEKPTKGEKQAAIVDGYHVTQTYNGSEWVTTDVGEKATPATPTTVSAPANQPYLVQDTGGKISQTPNPNYQPTDTAARVQQLQQLAQAKRDELNTAVLNGSKTKDQAVSEFDQWWTTTVEPVKQQLAQAQQQQISDATIKQNQELRDQQTAERNAFTTAQSADQNAVTTAQAGLANRVGPGFGAALNQIAGAYASGKPAGNLDIGSAVTYDMPDFSAIAEQATAQALAHLSPTAAGKVGSPLPSVPQGVDLNSALNQSQYRPTTTVAPDGTVTVSHQQSSPPSPDPFGTYRPPQLAPPVGPPRGPLYG